MQHKDIPAAKLIDGRHFLQYIRFLPIAPFESLFQNNKYTYLTARRTGPTLCELADRLATKTALLIHDDTAHFFGPGDMMEINQGAIDMVNEHAELLNLALKSAIECLDGIAAMNIALAQTVADIAAQISGSLMLIRRITEMASSPPALPVPAVPHSVEWQAIQTATDADFASTVDFNAWKEKHNIADLADSFRLSARSAEDISPTPDAANASGISEVAQEMAIAELVMQQEGGY